ncbi:MAG: DUF4124 domain-containing protein [Gammaproteobacteria bacterium]|nr:DUF4124 domain-containing protein [Gammaproteobacteria bacterium]
MKTTLTAVSVTLGCFVAPDAFADLDVYKCKDAQGRLNYTDSPCANSQVVSYSKVVERPVQYVPPKVSSVREPKIERVITKHKRVSSRSDVNVFAVNDKYKNEVFAERFKHPRTKEQDKLNKNLEKIEAKRRRELKGR